MIFDVVVYLDGHPRTDTVTGRRRRAFERLTDLRRVDPTLPAKVVDETGTVLAVSS